MSSQFNNTFITAPTSPNPYISRQLNNINKAKMFKKEQDNWIYLYHKTLKRLEVMINVQRQVQDILKMAEEANITIIEMEGTILKASINNRIMNTMNILRISEESYYQLLQSRGEQNPKFQKEVALAFMNNKHNTKILRNEYLINMYQGGPPHKPYLIAIDNQGQVIIGHNKKIVATYVVEELKVLI